MSRNSQKQKFHFGSLVEQLKKLGLPQVGTVNQRENGKYGAIQKVGQPFHHDFTFGISFKVAYAQKFIDGICLISGESCEFVCMVEEGETETIT